MDKEQVQKLAEEGSFQNQPLHDEKIETHASWVIFTDDYAFKIKKPVRFSFLDFSSIEKRKHFCEVEIELNSRLTGIYLDVQPIAEQDGKILIGESNEKPIDFAVRMKKMDPLKKMDEMLKHKAVTGNHVRKIARVISEFHQKAAVIHREFNKEKYQADFNDLDKSKDWVKNEIGREYSEIIEEAITYSDAFLKENKNLLRQRIEDGFHRDVHGDLHSRNIFLYDEPVIFDCIEFNEEFRQIDLLNELAFFCMDMEAFGRQELSEAFIEKYLSVYNCMRTPHEERLFNYYKVYRANIRAKVNLLKVTSENSEQLRDEVKKYLDLVGKYLQSN